MQPKIKVVGVGGSGSNTVSRMAKFNIAPVGSVDEDLKAILGAK